MYTQTRDSLAIDDLQVGVWYEFLSLGKYPYRGRWLGVEGRYGIMDVMPGVLAMFPNGAHIVRDLRWFAACKITPMPPQRRHAEYEDVTGRLIIEAVEAGGKADCEDRLDACDRQPVPHRDLRLIFGLAVFSAMVFIAGILWFFGR